MKNVISCIKIVDFLNFFKIWFKNNTSIKNGYHNLMHVAKINSVGPFKAVCCSLLFVQPGF